MDYHGGLAANIVQVINQTSGTSPQIQHLVLLKGGDSTALIRFHGAPGQTWRIQACDAIGGTWTTIGTAMAGSDGLIDATDAVGMYSLRFYRAVSP